MNDNALRLPWSIAFLSISPSHNNLSVFWVIATVAFCKFFWRLIILRSPLRGKLFNWLQNSLFNSGTLIFLQFSGTGNCFDFSFSFSPLSSFCHRSSTFLARVSVILSPNVSSSSWLISSRRVLLSLFLVWRSCHLSRHFVYMLEITFAPCPLIKRLRRAFVSKHAAEPLRRSAELLRL